ncbi:hypothetical protein PSTT_04696 [Puccinia striiformis]|uniref:PCI domain-containing protein n=1 Tax=Puccinia striiformis TaxID=27350 RepID=A0A2S4VRL2_9BASI|nr:hypothetical protein PSTT_04696 [Puccinia striiformis]
MYTYTILIFTSSKTDDLDHIKLDLNDQPSSSSTAPKPIAPVVNRSIQTNKINHKLEYYLALIGSSKGVALVKLIEDLLGSSGIYVFGEILETNLSKSHPTDASYHELLMLFAYGTWKDYRNRPNELPKLNEQQTSKLKLLTILDRALYSRVSPPPLKNPPNIENFPQKIFTQRNRHDASNFFPHLLTLTHNDVVRVFMTDISYSDLLEELEITETQALEELIIDGIYSGLLDGRLDQKYLRLEVESSVGRDVKLVWNPTRLIPQREEKLDGDVEMDVNNIKEQIINPSSTNSLIELHSKLASWRESTGKVLEQLDEKIHTIRQKDQVRLDQQVAQTTTIETLAQSIYSSILSSSSTSHNHRSNHNGGGGSNRRGKERDNADPLLLSDHQMDLDDHETVRSPSKNRKRTRP